MYKNIRKNYYNECVKFGLLNSMALETYDKHVHNVGKTLGILL